MYLEQKQTELGDPAFTMEPQSEGEDVDISVPMEDPVTGLPTKPLAERAFTEAFTEGRTVHIACFVLDRFAAVLERFGDEAGAELLLYYGMHLAQAMTGRDQLFHWVGPSFVAILNRPENLDEARRSVASYGSTRLAKLLRLPTRTVLLPVTGTWTVFPLPEPDSSETLVRKIDSYVAFGSV
ncbi:MAG: GGDEF domain-containing protein [Bryobacteraceae bacterium]